MATINYTMKVALDIVEAEFQRNKNDPDHDIATIWVSTTNTIDSRFVGGPTPIGSLATGQRITLDPASIATPEFLVNDDDEIALMVLINNRSFVSPDQAFSESLKIGGTILACVSAGEALYGFGLQAVNPSSGYAAFVTMDGLVGALVGAIAAGVGEILGDIGDLLGLDYPDCDGPVFLPLLAAKVKVTEIIEHIKQFRTDRVLTVDVPQPLLVWTDSSQVSQTGCGHNPSTYIRLVVTISNPTPIPALAGDSIGLPTHTKPLLSKPPKTWEGQWIDQRFMQEASIFADVQISESFKGRVAPMITVVPAAREALAALPTQGALIPNLSSSPILRDLVGGSPLVAAAQTSSRMSTGELTANVTERFTTSKTVAAQSVNLTAALVPMLAWDFETPTYAFDPSFVLHPIHKVPVNVSAPVATPLGPFHTGSPVGPGSSGTVSAPAGGLVTKTQFADTLVLGNGIVLQLFGAYDAQERFVGPRLRYMRVDGNGRIITDAMLQPPEQLIK